MFRSECVQPSTGADRADVDQMTATEGATVPPNTVTGGSRLALLFRLF